MVIHSRNTCYTRYTSFVTVLGDAPPPLGFVGLQRTIYLDPPNIAPLSVQTMPVYFIRDPSSDSIKIGRSATPQKRIGQLQTGNPHLLELMGWIETEGDVLAEQGLHRFYKAHRGIGE